MTTDNQKNISCINCGQVTPECANVCPSCHAIQPESAPLKTQTIAALWCGFLGSLGAHRFYLREKTSGIFYALFFWTGIPSLISWFEFITIAFTKPDEWAKKYNNGISTPAPHWSIKAWAFVSVVFAAIGVVGIIAAFSLPAYQKHMRSKSQPAANTVDAKTSPSQVQKPSDRLSEDIGSLPEYALEFQKGAEKGDPSAQFLLGLVYELGVDVREDYDQARYWYEKAAAQGHANAQSNLGFMYSQGHGVRQDLAQARQWFEKAAEQGDANSQYKLGRMYHQGIGTDKDYTQARQWFEKAAAQGDANSQSLLGGMFSLGLGVRQDYAQSRQWYEKAAAQGHSTAQHNLGVMYNEGHGVRQNRVTAKEWFGKSCDNGAQIACDKYRELNQ